MAIRLAHASSAVEISDSCRFLALLGLGNWMQDALDELLLLGELIFRRKNKSLPLLQALLAHGFVCTHLRQLPPVAERRGRMALAQSFDLVIEDTELGITSGDELVNDVLATSLSTLLPESIYATSSLFLCCCPCRGKVFEGEVIGMHLLLVLR